MAVVIEFTGGSGAHLHSRQPLIISDLSGVMGGGKLEQAIKDVSRQAEDCSALRKGTSARCKLQLFFEAMFITVLQVNLASKGLECLPWQLGAHSQGKHTAPLQYFCHRNKTWKNQECYAARAGDC